MNQLEVFGQGDTGEIEAFHHGGAGGLAQWAVMVRAGQGVAEAAGQGGDVLERYQQTIAFVFDDLLHRCGLRGDDETAGCHRFQ